MVLRPQRLVSYDLGLHYTRDRVKDRSRVHLSSWEYDLTLDDARLLTERIDMPLLVNLHVEVSYDWLHGRFFELGGQSIPR